MAAIVTSNFRTLNAGHFKDQVEGSSVYVSIGKSDVWSLTTSADKEDMSLILFFKRELKRFSGKDNFL